MFHVTGAFENQQYIWKPICWHKCSNKVVNLQLTLSIIGRKQILTWPLSRLIQFTVILLQSNYENTVCRIRHCESWNSKFLTHATKSLHRHCIYKMILWKISNSKDIEENLHLFAKHVSGRKTDSAPGCERLALLWVILRQVVGRAMLQRGKCLALWGFAPETNQSDILCSWTQNSLGE